MHCRLDYCNALLAGVADVHLKRPCSHYRMLQLDSCPHLAVAIPLRQSSHVCIGCRFVNESPSRRRYWCGKLSTVQLWCICRTFVFQWPRCQVDSIYGRRLLESWWFQKGLGRQQASGALPSTGRPSETVMFTSCSDHWGRGSSII